ncbi:hypothetical protein KC19_2G178400 [Ceratodon purpureus]|uniref:AB hydrolase-1 domain-containing protein n=1 Tax=Ceratodon purpureus TaxID=3225 RepID=A0A8T0IXI2_CERPU|nr:hypothetical protein KC19_2G178400 [Ceratodon purpureus]
MKYRLRMAVQRVGSVEVWLSALNYIVFGICGLLDKLLCPVFRFLDWQVDRNSTPCHCAPHPSALGVGDGGSVYNALDFWRGPSHTLYERGKKWNAGRGGEEEDAVGSSRIVSFVERWKTRGRRKAVAVAPSSEVATKSKRLRSTCWSDCGCETCTAWLKKETLLYVHADCKDFDGKEFDSGVHNVIFVHGFLSSSSFWVETVLPHLSKEVRSSHRLFAVDVLGFGKSPRPHEFLYTNADHVEMIRRSVLEKYGIKKFHLVAHSMGCTIALALAGQDPAAVNSITILAPLYFPTRPGVPPASYVLSNVAPQKVWPFFAFVHALMSWYEHLGRVVCLVFCKHHRFWIPLMTFFSKLLGSRMPASFIHDYMQHSHNSAFKMFHNTICAGPFVMEHSMTELAKAGRHVHVIHGEDDGTCSVECGVALTRKFTNVTLSRIPGADHLSVVLGREQELAQELETQILGHYQ